MKDTEKRLKSILSNYFIGHGQRLSMMSNLILALCQLRTVNFSELALVINGAVKLSSNFKRIQRFVKSYVFLRQSYVRLAWDLYGGQGKWVALSMDRTNWCFGKLDINILMIGISWRGIAIPLVWELLPKRGQSNVKERIDLLDKLLDILPSEDIHRIRYLLMDREFGATNWLAALKKRSIGFLLRIRIDAKVRRLGQHKVYKAKQLFRCTHFSVLRKPRVIFQHQLYIGGQQLSSKEYLILVSDTPLFAQGSMYAERWGIEVLFGALKTRGFNFESTRLNRLERIDTLLYLLCIAFIWAFRTGEMLLEKGEQIAIKTLKNRKAKLKSIFRIGLDHIRQHIFNNLDLKLLFQLLSCT